METNNAKSPPNHLLGYTIRSHTRIFVSYIIPVTLAAFVYIVQFIADCAVSYAHFARHQTPFAWATLSLVLISPLITFTIVLCSKSQWNNPKFKSSWHFIGFHVVRLVLFPFFTIYRFAYRIFWSIEALFQENDDKERMVCLEKATECDTCELYLLIQAFAQAAPQIILQMYNMLTQDLFRDYQTTTVQAISLVFSAIDLAAITTSYQRFESQRQVGRTCPWSTPEELAAQQRMLECDARLRNECECRKRDSEKNLTHFPQSDKVMENFKKQSLNASNEDDKVKSHSFNVQGFDEVDDNEDADDIETTVLIHKTMHSNDNTTVTNATDDDKIRSNPKLNIPPKIQRQNSFDDDEITVLDTVPDSPPPMPPQLRNDATEIHQNCTHNKRASRTFSQLETFKDMLIVNAQLYIKEHMPHPPKMLIQRLEAEDSKRTGKATAPPASPITPKSDEVDFFLPRPTKIVNGIQQEDFAAKSIAFFGWISYILMRMLALAAFSCFYPKEFFIIVGVHFIVMLLALCFESRCKGKFNISLFYIVLAYVYIFVILEFRVKFKRIRVWFIGYFIITMAENIVMTSIWNAKEEFESWWFGFITESIIYSGILFIATLIVYYYLLRPKDVTLIVEENL